MTAVGDELERFVEREYREVDIPERNVRRLLGPDGRVLASVSDTPPTGFHQGSRSGS